MWTGESMSKTSWQVKNKYNAKAYDRLTIVVRKEDTKNFKDYVTAKGETISGYIKRLIKQDSGIDL
jgi:hypothetical protein